MSHNKSLWIFSVALLAIIVVILGLAPGAWAASKYKSLHTFRGADGAEPTAGLIFDQAGNLYGTTASGGAGNGGTVFKLTRNSDGSRTQSVLYAFCSVNNCGDGMQPFAGLIFDQKGNLYGTTSLGGTCNIAVSPRCGTVFKLTPNSNGGWSESVLYSFCSLKECLDGWVPLGGLIFDRAGNLYGTTVAGGPTNCVNSGCGTVFKLTPKANGSWTETVLYGFCSGTNCGDGFYPAVNLIFDGAGNLYGTTLEGGVSRFSNCGGFGCGVVFKLAPTSQGGWSETVLYNFCSRANCGDGWDAANLIFDQSGNLYGSAALGGSNSGPCSKGCGVVFQLTPKLDGRWTEKVLHRFTGSWDGRGPGAGLIFDRAGNLYGTTRVGGDLRCNNSGCGVVFKLAPNSKGGWDETVLHDFFDQPGAVPEAGLIFDSAGNLYGTTAGDFNINTSFGSVFEITP
jgi:uncharacterized repeat protein (TIGR03803 family)